MTEIKVAIASILAAALFLVSTVAAGRGYRHASDLVIRPVEVGAAASQPATPRARPSQAIAPKPGPASPAPAPVPRATSSVPPPVIVVPPPPASEIRVGRVVYSGSTDDYEDDADGDEDRDEDADDGK